MAPLATLMRNWRQRLATRVLFATLLSFQRDSLTILEWHRFWKSPINWRNRRLRAPLSPIKNDLTPMKSDYNQWMAPLATTLIRYENPGGLVLYDPRALLLFYMFRLWRNWNVLNRYPHEFARKWGILLSVINTTFIVRDSAVDSLVSRLSIISEISEQITPACLMFIGDKEWFSTYFILY